MSFSENGLYLAIGAYGDQNFIGCVFIFKYSGGKYTEIQRVVGDKSDKSLAFQGKRTE